MTLATYGKFQKTQGGSGFVLFGSAGLAIGNALLDSSRYDEHMKNKKDPEIPHVPDQKDDLSYFESLKKDYRFTVVLGEKNF